MPRHPGGVREQPDHAQACGFRDARRAGEDLERQGLQAVAHEHRGRLVEGDVTGGAPPAEVVVVHGGEVVVHEGIRVDVLERGGGIHGGFHRSPEGDARGARDRGPQPLAAAERRVAQRLDELR